MAMAVAVAVAAKVLRGGRSGSSSPLLQVIGRRVPQAGMLPPPGSSSLATPAAGMGRALHTSESSMIKQVGGTFRRVNGHFEPSDSEFVVLHLHERLRKLERYSRFVRRHWMYPALMLVSPMVMMASLVAVDYYKLNQIEKELHKLRQEIADLEVECEALDIAINGL